MILTSDLIARLGARFFQYNVEGTLPYSGALRTLLQVQIQVGYHFWAEQLNIVFNTLATEDEETVDTGVCDFSALFKSGGNAVALANDFLDLATIAIPGRQRTAGVAGDPSNGLYEQGFPFPYFFEGSGSIQVELQKAATGPAETAKFVWTGFLIPQSICRNSEEFFRMLAEVYPNYGAQG